MPRAELAHIDITLADLRKEDKKIEYFERPSDEELNVLLNYATAFVQTSRHEGFCLTILEAMAAGTPVITTNADGNMDFCVCAIYDGKDYHLGLSCAFEFPKKVTQMIHEEGIDANEAFYRLGLTADRKIGSSEGAIGMLTKGRMSRKDYTKQAVQMALIHLENKDLY